MHASFRFQTVVLLVGFALLLPWKMHAGERGGGVRILSGDIEPAFCRAALSGQFGDDIFRCYRFFEHLQTVGLLTDETGALKLYPLLLVAEPQEALPRAEASAGAAPGESLLSADARVLLQRIAAQRAGQRRRRDDVVFDPAFVQPGAPVPALLRVQGEGFLEDLDAVHILQPQTQSWQTVPLTPSEGQTAPGAPVVIQNPSVVAARVIADVTSNATQSSQTALSSQPQVSAAVLFDSTAPSLIAKGTGIQVSQCENAAGFVFYLLSSASFTCENEIIATYDGAMHFNPQVDLTAGQFVIDQTIEQFLQSASSPQPAEDVR